MLDFDNNNKIDSIEYKLKTIIDKIVFDNNYEEGKDELIKYFTHYSLNEKIISIFFNIMNNIINHKNNSQYKTLSIIPFICQIKPKLFLNYVDIIISLFQNSINKECNSPYISQISQYFGDTIKIIFNELNSGNYNTIMDKNLLLKYHQIKNFCIFNIQSDKIYCQISGTLFLTSFIENCSFNYINKENLKNIFEILCERINNNKFIAKLEILNCFISLIYCSEENYFPYAKDTLNIVIKFINSKEWLIKKFVLNIIYLLLLYFKKELLEKRNIISDNLKNLKNEKNIEIKDMIEQIYILLNEENNNKNELLDLNSDEEFSEKKLRTDRQINNNNNKNDYEKNKAKNKGNNNIKSKDMNNIIVNKKMKDNINKIIKNIKRNKSVEKSRNSLDKYFIKRKKQTSLIIKKSNRSNNISLDKKIKINKIKNFEFNTSERYKKIFNLKKINNNSSNINNQMNLTIRKENKYSKTKYLFNSAQKRKENIFNKNTKKIIKNKKNIKLEANKRNNNSLEIKKNNNNDKHMFIKVIKHKKLNKNQNREDIINKINYNKDIDKYINNNNYKYIQSNNKHDKVFPNSENHSFLNINTKSNNISSSSNNNITINNNVISIRDEPSSKKETSFSIENIFMEYKNQTNKIINELKSQVNSLKASLSNYQKKEKNKTKLIYLVKNNNFEEAFEIAVNIQEVNYVIKNYILNNKKEIILSNKILGNVMRILCKDILLCDNLRLIIMFIIKNVCEKKCRFDRGLNKEIYETFFELYNKRKELCLLKKDINSILKIVDYFKEIF